jgi:hypothetical protein
MNITLYALVAETGAASILQNGIDVSNNVAETWNKQWLTIFQSELYYTIVALAGGFAAASLLFFMLNFFHRMTLQEDYAAALQSMVLAMGVIVLLANNAYVLSHGTLALRGMIHNVSEKVLSQTLLEVSLEDAIQASVDKGTVSTEISALLSQCEGMVGQKQQDCFKSANEQANSIIQDYQAKHPQSQALDNFKTLAGNQSGGFYGLIQQGLAGFGSELANGGTGGEGGAGFAAGMLGAISQSIIQTLLYAFQWAFANILEIALLLTGLMGPLAVAGALMFDGKSLWGWLTGFFAIGMAQICYNIIVGVAAVVVVNADVTDTLGFLVIISVLAPALALGLASGGGLVVFTLITAGVSSGLMTLASQAPTISVPSYGGSPSLRGD